MAAIVDRDRDTASRVTDAPHLPAAAKNVRGPATTLMRNPDGSLNVGTMEGKEVVEIMKRRNMEVLCVLETKWKGDRARKMPEGYKMLHAGGDGRSNRPWARQTFGTTQRDKGSNMFFLIGLCM